MGPIERLTEHLEKPEVDNRSYRVIRLENKLEALLVHDPDTDKASAACNVNVGNFSDYDDMAGLSHAVEHLLFMGTEKVSSPALIVLFENRELTSPCNNSFPKRMPTTNISPPIQDHPTPTPQLQRQTTSLKCLLHRLTTMRTTNLPLMDRSTGPQMALL